MRLVTAITSDADQWFESVRDLKSIRQTAKILGSKMLLVTGPAFAAEYRVGLRALENKEVASAIQDLIEVTPRAVRRNNSEIDVSVGLDFQNGKTLDDLADDDLLDVLLKSRTATIQNGESRQAAFDRTLKPLVGSASRVDLADRYAASVLVDSKSSRNWLIRQLLRSTDLTICISTGLQEDFRNEFTTISQKMAAIEDSVSRLLRQNKTFCGNIQIDVYEVTRHIFHNRRMRFLYASSEISLSLEKGLDTFAHDPMPEQHALATMQSGDFNRYLKSLRTQNLIGQLSFSGH